MPQFIYFPRLPPGEYRNAIDTFIQALRQMPVDGEPFKDFRARLKKIDMWSRESLPHLLRFLRMAHSDPVVPSPFVRSLHDASGVDQARHRVIERLWTVNPLLFKVALERMEERVHSPNELLKYVDSFAYPGNRISGPEVRAWVAFVQGLGLLKPVGIRLGLTALAKPWLEKAHALDVDDFLEEDADEPMPMATKGESAASGSSAPLAMDADDAVADGSAAPPPGPTSAASPPVPLAATAARPSLSGAQAGPALGAASGVASGVPATRSASAGHASAHPMRQPAQSASIASGPDPIGRHRPVPTARFATHGLFDDDVLATTRERIIDWWAALSATGDAPDTTAPIAAPTADDWMEDPPRVLFRAAVLAGLHGQAGRTDASAAAAYAELDRTGVLDALHDGTAPEVAPTVLDAGALMLASVIARRCAENPELSSELEKQKTAAEAFLLLDRALGRGLFTLELFALMALLGTIGAVPTDGLADFVARPDRLVRDTLYRLGFLEQPYAPLPGDLAAAAAAAHLAVPDERRADVVLRAFAHRAGCAFGCARRRVCDLPCRERTDPG